MLEKLFEQIESELMTDEVKLQMQTMFESALNESIEAEKKQLDEKNRVEITEFKDNLVEQLDEYLNYLVEEIMAEKDETIVESVRVAQAEKIMEAFKSLTTEFHIATSEEVIVEGTRVEQLEAVLDKEVNSNIEMQKDLASLKKKIAIMEAAEKIDVISTKEKFVALASTIDYVDGESFDKKLDVIMESIKPEKTEDQLDEEIKGDNDTVIEEEFKKQESAGAMTGYLKYFKK